MQVSYFSRPSFLCLKVMSAVPVRELKLYLLVLGPGSDSDNLSASACILTALHQGPPYRALTCDFTTSRSALLWIWGRKGVLRNRFARLLDGVKLEPHICGMEGTLPAWGTVRGAHLGWACPLVVHAPAPPPNWHCVLKTD